MRAYISFITFMSNFGLVIFYGTKKNAEQNENMKINAGPFNRVGQFIFLLNMMEYTSVLCQASENYKVSNL